MSESAPPAVASAISTEAAAPARKPWGVFWAFLLLGALAGGLGWYLVGEYREYFPMSDEFASAEISMSPDPEVVAKMSAAQAERRLKNNTFAIALIGGAIVGLLSLAPGLGRGRPGQVLLGLVAGVVLGLGLGAAGGFAGTKLNEYIAERYASNDSTVGMSTWQVYNTMFTQACYWLLIGLGLSIALGLVGGKRVFGRMLMITIGLAVFWCLCYPFTAAILFPFASTDRPIPEGSENTLYWIGVFALLAALGAGRVFLKDEAAPAPTPAPQ